MRIAFDAYTELLPLSKLKKSKHQRNKHPKEQIERLAKIMEAHGIRHPIHISKLSGEVCFGHGRWEAAKLNKYTEYPVVYQEFANEDEEYACVQSDNAIAHWAELDLSSINNDLQNLGPDFDIDLLGIKDFVLEPAEKYEAQCDEDEVPEAKETRCKRGDIWQLGKHRLMCGDSGDPEQVKRLTGETSIDLVFTDPPYGLDGKNYFNDYHYDYDDAVAYDLTRLNFEKRDFVIWGANYYDYLPQPRPKIGWVVWDKRPTRDHWDQETRESADRRFGQHFEIAVTNVKGVRGKMIRKTWGGFYGTAGHKEDEIVHKTQKPIELLTHFIADNHKTVLDYFGGSGSTLIACEKLERQCFAMEIMPEYCDVILTRWEKYTGQMAERLDGQTKEEDGPAPEGDRREASQKPGWHKLFLRRDGSGTGL